MDKTDVAGKKRKGLSNINGGSVNIVSRLMLFQT